MFPAQWVCGRRRTAAARLVRRRELASINPRNSLESTHAGSTNGCHRWRTYRPVRDHVDVRIDGSSLHGLVLVGNVTDCRRQRENGVEVGHRKQFDLALRLCVSNKTALAMVFKLVGGAQKSCRRLDGYNQLPKVIEGVKFTNGIAAVRQDVPFAAA
jgi:hypothetical protein